MQLSNHLSIALEKCFSIISQKNGTVLFSVEKPIISRTVFFHAQLQFRGRGRGETEAGLERSGSISILQYHSNLFVNIRTLFKRLLERFQYKSVVDGISLSPNDTPINEWSNMLSLNNTGNALSFTLVIKFWLLHVRYGLRFGCSYRDYDVII